MQDLGIRVLFMGDNFLRLLGGLWITIKVSLIAVVLSILLGTLLGMIMTLKNPITRCITRVYLDFIRIMPQLVLLFLVYFGLTKSFGINLSGQVSAVIVFTMWGTAEIGDLVRGALISIPKHQYESGQALGLTGKQIYGYIIIPQTLRRLIPLAINLTTRMIKTTSLIVLIGVVEVLKVGQQIIEANRYTVPDSALWIYAAIFFLYFLACWPISLLASGLEKKWKD
ncbi:amino acid ABC transporter permease [Faecalicatena contorta]|uniref:Amino acid ABC transporter membrane protein 2, PAAT family n=1 Tax=Faecalicatena contorta TaxID=39482 RepID=A0A316A2G7_9FIRM|nr:amino acid ABC transporter permease [Faecalicatena contorta]PWJ52136.1 amino acid ABC transporter membrane protein 2 (PAAT family) [Faecalicatena contorta]SUQ12414.1 amino acid ABC transporter membrane protein 2, PAAT family [Faecalicatena contorta]